MTGYDVDESIRLMRVATQAAATDPRTGTIDMDMITTGRTAVDRDMVLQLAEELRTFFSTHKGQRFSLTNLRNDIASGSDAQISMHEIEEAVKEVLESDDPGIKYVGNTQTVIVEAN